MLKDKALKKIFITSITLLILLILYLIPNIENNETLKTNLELEYISGVGTNSIYLLDKNNYLVKSRILLTKKTLREKIITIIDNLTIGNKSSFPDGLTGTIPEGVELLNIDTEDKIVTLNFSKDIMSVSMNTEKLMIESIVYSIMDLSNTDGVKIEVEGNMLESYPNSKEILPKILTKDIGINTEYNLTKRDDINKVVIYYLENIDDANYYVPVTRYVNDSRDKIKIIIDNLTTSYIYEPNLMSMLSSTTKLNSYSEEEGVMFLDFNNNIYNNHDTVLEEVIYSICYSIFDNYDVKTVIMTVDNNSLKEVNKNDLF